VANTWRWTKSPNRLETAVRRSPCRGAGDGPNAGRAAGW
jgi:hypothetical protein